MGELIQLYGFVEYQGGKTLGERKDIFLIPYQEIASLARRVPEEEFGEEALNERLKDLEWMKAELLAHEQVLEEAMKRRTVVPLRWGSLFRTEEAVQRILKEQYETVRKLLDELKDCEEWTIRAFVDRGRLEEEVFTEGPEIQRLRATIEKSPSGSAYLLTERLKLLTEEARQQTIEAVIQELYAQLMIHAEASANAEPLRGTAESQELELVFQMAFLVHREKIKGFSEALLQAARRWKSQGFDIHQVGPFPPYYFTHIDLKSGETHG